MSWMTSSILEQKKCLHEWKQMSPGSGCPIAWRALLRYLFHCLEHASFKGSLPEMIKQSVLPYRGVFFVWFRSSSRRRFEIGMGMSLYSPFLQLFSPIYLHHELPTWIPSGRMSFVLPDAIYPALMPVCIVTMLATLSASLSQ